MDEEIRQDELKKAREESYNEGIRNNKIEIAKSLLKSSMELKDISKHTGLTPDEIKKLQ